MAVGFDPDVGDGLDPDERVGVFGSASVPCEALLDVLVLGPLAVFARPAPGQPLRGITGRLSPTQRLILAALAASTDPVHTETLLDMCFAGSGGDEALHRLQSNITRLRAALRAAIGHDTAIKLIAHTAGRAPPSSGTSKTMNCALRNGADCRRVPEAQSRAPGPSRLSRAGRWQAPASTSSPFSAET